MTAKKDIMTKNSKYHDAFMAVFLDPASWGRSVDEIRNDVYNWLKKHHKGAKVTKPCVATYYRVIKHPDFQAELAKSRSALVRKAMPAIENKLVELIVDHGDLKAYDRLKKAIGEDNVHSGSIEIHGGVEITDGDVEAVLDRMSRARETRPPKDKLKPKAIKKKKKKK